MKSASGVAWLTMLVAMGASTFLGFLVSRSLPWSASARRARIDTAFGAGVAPLLLGLAVVAVLGVLPGASHSTHVLFVAASIFASSIVIGKFFYRPRQRLVAGPVPGWGLLEFLLLFVLIAWGLGLLINALFLPLTQNDSLEYATVGRLLFEVREITAYPALDPQRGSSGFYGPWTHPPLYPALIYLSYALQQHAESPVLMRLIAPWCALGATGLIFTLGSLANRLTGLFSAICFLSTPLFFLGADSALIDALPILGTTLIVSLVIGIRHSTFATGMAVGGAIGVSLWTHSEAVLLLPLASVALVLKLGWAEPRKLLSTLAIVWFAAVVIAAWPYGRNVLLVGSIISDNPAVFGIPALGWQEYFRFARGVESWPSTLQYGVFKGWFAIEAYALVFWIMTLGVVIYCRRTYRFLSQAELCRGSFASLPDHWLIILLGFVVCYMLGVVASIAIGLDVMVRNERYTLLVLPCVALWAGWSIATCIGSSGAGRHTSSRSRKQVFLTIAVVLMFSAQLMALTQFRLKANGLSILEVGRSKRATLLNRPEYRAIEYLRYETDPTDLVLSLKPADMYYADRRMISYLDPRLLVFYDQRDPVRAAAILQSLKVQYIHVPEYYLPPVYNSALQGILANPKLSRLVFSSDGNQIYALRCDQHNRLVKRIAIEPAVWPWTRATLLLVGGRKSLGRIVTSETILGSDGVSSTEFGFPLFQRDWSTMLISGSGSPTAKDAFIEAQGGATYRLRLDLAGRGFVEISVRQFNAGGQPLDEGWSRSKKSIALGDLVLGPRYPSRVFERRFVSFPNTRYLRVAVEHRGQSAIRIVDAKLDVFGPGGGCSPTHM